jgi:hypothetical protein
MKTRLVRNVLQLVTHALDKVILDGINTALRFFVMLDLFKGSFGAPLL